MLFFLLIAACVSEEVTLGFGADVAGSITVKLDPTVVLDKCIATKYINFKITKEGEKYYGALYKDNECKTVIDALNKIELTVFTQAVQLPDFQEGITINLDAQATGAVTVAYPFGCLLSFFSQIKPNLFGKIDADLDFMNLAFVHTQFGVSVHSYTDGKCEGEDTIKEILTKASEQVKNAVNGIKVSIGEALEQLPTEEEFATAIEKSKNMFEAVKKELYSYAEQLPTIANETIYEFNGTVMKVYQKVGEQLKYVKDLASVLKSKIINILGENEILITGDCDGGFQYGWSGDKFQKLKMSGSCDFTMSLGDLFSVNMDVDIAEKFDKTITVNGKTYELHPEQFASKLKDAKTAVVESLGSMREFEMNECYQLRAEDILFSMLDTFSQHVSINIPDWVMSIVKTFGEITQELRKWMDQYLPKFYYKVKPLEIQMKDEVKNYATFVFYMGDKGCVEENNLFDIIVGKIDETINTALDQAYKLVKYLGKDDCNSKKDKEGYVKEYIDADVCINGYMYVFEDEALTFQKCTGDNTKQAQLKQETIVFQCGTCVECMKEQGIISEGDYAYVDCGASGIFTILLVLLFFVLF